MNSLLRTIFPIYGLGWIVNNIRLNDSTTIRFINNLDKNDENELIEKVGLKPIKYKCVLEISQHYDPKDYNQDPWLEAIQLAKKVESALRVFHKGRIGIAAAIFTSRIEYRSAQILDTFIPNGQENYRITKTKLGEFADFYRVFEAAYEIKPLAFQYFSEAQQRFRKTDKAIDYCVALENLFVPPGSRGAKKIFIKQGMRILGFDTKDIETINNLYEYRNAMVHGTPEERLKLFKKKISNYTMRWFEECERVMREILQGYVKKPW